MTTCLEFDPNRDFLPVVGMKLRDADKAEYEASRGRPMSNNFPIIENICRSNQAWVYYDQGELIMVGGAMAGGVIWAVGTERTKDVIKPLSEAAGRLMKDWLALYGSLCGAIYKHNTAHVRWLSRFGFEFFESENPDFLLFVKIKEINHV